MEYSKLVKAPVECIQDLYEHYGFRLTPEVEQRMRDYLAANPKHKNGIHKYSMEEYGLCEQDIYDKFGNYLNYFQDISQNLVWYARMFVFVCICLLGFGANSSWPGAKRRLFFADDRSKT